jgi:UDP-N-acetylmuramate dehydrogenase
VAELIRLSRACREDGLPLFVLGGGANILVSDRGIRGLVLDTGALRGVERRGDSLECLSGTPMSEVSERAADERLTGLEFLYSMPGSVGGSVWMNARCYGSQISDVLEWVELLDLSSAAQGEPRRVRCSAEQFGYKRSPFQQRPCVILRASFLLRPGDPRESLRRMEGYREDRERKGHFLLPSAGSAFKNNRDFGAPTGKLIDDLGLTGHRVGAAAVSRQHGNIIVNLGGATAADVLRLLELLECRVLERYGFRLEREILLVGEWERGGG